jgi:hypothetical protein
MHSTAYRMTAILRAIGNLIVMMAPTTRYNVEAAESTAIVRRGGRLGWG